MNSKVMRNLSYGLFVVSTKNGEKDNGCICNTVCQVTTTPNVITLALNKQNFTTGEILKTGILNVSIISQSATFKLFERFGFTSGKTVNKFENYSACNRGENGVYYITEGVNSYFGAKVLSSTDLGSHILFTCQVTEGEILSSDESATYAYYFKNIKPKGEAKSQKKWRCAICGYVYDGENLPADYVCPICKHPASDFELS